MPSLLKSFVLTTTFSTLTAFAGAGSSGGGTVVLPSPDAQPLLLDLFVANPKLQDPVGVSSSVLSQTKFMSLVGLDVLPVKSLPAYALVEQRLLAWRKAAPFITARVDALLSSMSFYYTSDDLPVSPEYALSDSLRAEYPALKLEGVFFYEGAYGTTASIPVWNQLGALSQAGLLIHEALRHLQIDYGMDVSNESLQTLTATLMLGDPTQVKGHLEDTVELGESLSKAVHQSIAMDSVLRAFDKLECSGFLAQFTALKSDLPEEDAEIIAFFKEKSNQGCVNAAEDDKLFLIAGAAADARSNEMHDVLHGVLDFDMTAAAGGQRMAYSSAYRDLFAKDIRFLDSWSDVVFQTLFDLRTFDLVDLTNDLQISMQGGLPALLKCRDYVNGNTQGWSGSDERDAKALLKILVKARKQKLKAR